MVCFVFNVPIQGDSDTDIINNKPVIQCYPIFARSLFNGGEAIIFREWSQNCRILGPYMRAMGDLHFLYQIPAKFTTQLSKNESVILFEPQIIGNLKKLYGFNLVHNKYLRRFYDRQRIFHKTEVCFILFVFLLYFLP